MPMHSSGHICAEWVACTISKTWANAYGLVSLGASILGKWASWCFLIYKCAIYPLTMLDDQILIVLWDLDLIIPLQHTGIACCWHSVRNSAWASTCIACRRDEEASTERDYSVCSSSFYVAFKSNRCFNISCSQALWNYLGKIRFYSLGSRVT